ncbi:hypothetical protein MJ257_10535 [Paenibacillus timonensis]|jgi:hypothetical protein|uniref:Uncharacterized protein n=1 Tax=Paenibacillus timonensis TaxID=225915 RepID=A0ABW3SBA8_9BACL|nr:MULTISPECIES: hypothetical protein [Paenibacillus]MCH1640545.1 hypothetical protein [Paenibacillus timonensis]MDU2241985.1 hypothetical protein [Paenibacillus sp.]GJM83586.1 hypothetical protein HMSSN139_60820 [Paenibacillus sp. HMSSN-139]
MPGKLRYYLLSGLIGFLITFAVSAGNNLFMTSFIRGLISFAVWFLLAFAAGWVLGFLKEMPSDFVSAGETVPAAEGGKGGNLDLMTPDESEQLGDLLKPAPAASDVEMQFAPLNPPKLVKTPDDKDPEELVKVVRHLTEQ